METTKAAIQKLVDDKVIDPTDAASALRQITIIDTLILPIAADLQTQAPAVIAPILKQILDAIG